MKQIFGFLFLVLLFSSCTKTDYLSQSIQKQVVGKWKLEQSLHLVGSDSSSYYDFKSFSNVTYDFKENGYLTVKGPGYDSTGIYQYQVENSPYFIHDNDTTDPGLNILTFDGNRYSIEIGFDSSDGSVTVVGKKGNKYIMHLSNFNKGITLTFSRE
ncbi:hypothetical protein MNBD_BACTEROID07-522 [hydrothermal vent metagenome]|uniref:Lipocalin-like domain-containing protein n=1 Tax=hydrothermal vent metagenome TaxID=652676 RepID=A0A3B0V6M7_9ZZZZ